MLTSPGASSDATAEGLTGDDLREDDCALCAQWPASLRPALRIAIDNVPLAKPVCGPCQEAFWVNVVRLQDKTKGQVDTVLRMPRSVFTGGNGNAVQVRQRMTMTEKPQLTPCQYKDGSGWYVEARWTDGFPEHIFLFNSEAEARDWIDREAAAYFEARFIKPIAEPDKS